MPTFTHGLTPDQLTSVLGERQRVRLALEDALAHSEWTSTLGRSASRIAELLNSELIWSGHDPATGPDDPALIEFVERWIIDVASMSDDTVAAVRSLLGDDGLMDFIHALLVIEQRIRLDLAWQQLGLQPTVDAPVTDPAGLVPQAKTGPPANSDRARAPVDVPACPGRIARGHHGNARLRDALSEWQAAVVCLDEIDPVTTELVRLRCANHHDCHT